MDLPQLVVADYRSGRNHTVHGGTVRPLGSAVLAEHAGVLALPGGRSWAFVDDRGGALVVCDGDGCRRIPVAIPGEHLACDATGTHLVVTTGIGANSRAWSDVVTVVDVDSGESVRFRTRVGEPGIMVVSDQLDGEPSIVLRHREPGALEAIPLQRGLDAAPHVPRLTGEATTDVGDDGHGDVVDQQTGIAATATSRGLERFVVDHRVPRPIGVVPWPVPGRAFYLRFDPVTGRVVGVCRGGPTAPSDWTAWTNHLVDVDLSTGHTRSTPLPAGLAFRFALGGGRAAVATIHPDGDTLTIIDRSGPSMRAVRTESLPALSHPPVPGRLPWDPVGDSPAQRRAVALDPSGAVVAVTRGGDGQLHLIGEDGIDTITMPTPLDEGGHLYWQGSAADTVGR
ncbi:hypothetical protein B1813_02530 [Saccharomonospora piscinae]|uniref:Uncharacterized protein n=1 Tax=Saccharomonospora piscinae TaxID=687388 RepID=A0A1V9AD03_SACPI|nr:hypothetical protein [Saccharomonospora piscinae]OQO94961.1 hypothetical protein B1813_02530 [Saccharomonospora piscinae]